MKDKPFVVVFCLVVFMGLGSAASVWGEARTALIIGNGDYSHFSPLSRPVPEAISLKSSLERLGFEVILVTDADRETMFEKLYRFETTVRERGGIALFHYGGHGLQVEGKNYLIPVNADIPDELRVRTRAVNVEEVMATLEASGSETNIVILDACRNNPLPGKERSAARGLAAIERKPKNSIIVYSAEAGTVARDGVFTPTLVKHLSTPGARFTDVLREVRKEVYEITGGEQTPGAYDQSFEPIYLAGYTGGSPVSPGTGSTGAGSATGSASGGTDTAGRLPAASEGAVCELFISTSPSGAEITINGEKKGTSPQLIPEIPLYSSVIIEARQDTLYGREEVSFKERGMHELSLVLRQQTGNLFIKSSDPDVDVYLDGRRLGPLNTGLFKELPVGTFPLELKAKGAYWQKTVTIEADQSTRVDAEPAYFGRLHYRLPDGTRAEITGERFKETVRGRGTLDQMWVGSYSITVTGEIYNEISKTVSVRRGQEVMFSPELSYTKDYVEGRLTDRLRPLERKIESESLLSPNDIDALEAVRTDIRTASYRLPELEGRAGRLLDTARTLLEEQQRKAAYSAFARKLTDVAGLLEGGRGINEQDVRNARSLTSEITKARYSFPDLVERAEGISEALQEQYSEQLRREAYGTYTAALDEAERALAPQNRVTDDDIRKVKSLAADIGKARFRFPKLIARSSGLVKKLETKQTVDSLTARQQELQLQLQKSMKASKGGLAGGIVSLSVGVIGGGLAGLFMYLAEESYNRYMDATVTSDAAAFRQEFQTFDILSYISAGAGGVSLGVSTLLFATRPNPETYRERLDEIEHQLDLLKGAE